MRRVLDLPDRHMHKKCYTLYYIPSAINVRQVLYRQAAAHICTIKAFTMGKIKPFMPLVNL